MKLDLFRELQRRDVYRAAILYITSAWLVAQVITTLGPAVDAPEWLTRWFLIAAVIGFPFWIAFAWIYEFTPQGLKRESEVEADQSNARATGRKLNFIIIGVLSVAVVLLLTDYFVGHHETASAPIAAAPAIPDKSVAVLPLVNENGDPDALYFSDGLSEGFITALSQFPGLKVISRHSSFQFRNSKLSSAVIGEKLGVAHLLEGSVQRAGDEVRISAELINAKDGSTLWSKHYDRSYKDLFKLQDEITQAVATALNAKLLGARTLEQSARPPSGNVAAYIAFLQGRFYSRRTTEESFRKEIDAYKTAVRIDPRYAVAWAELALGWDSYGELFLGGVAQKEAYANARKAADTALALAPDSDAAHAARAAVLRSIDFDWAGAEAENRRALQLAPNDPASKGNLALDLDVLGRLNEAVDLYRQAIATDPYNANYRASLAIDLIALGRLDEAEKAIRKAIDLQPGGASYQNTLSWIAILRGNAKAALGAAEAESPGVWQEVAVMQALQIGTDRAAADAALKSFISKYSTAAAFQIAEAYALRKNPDAMFDWLDRALAIRDPGLQGLLVDPFILRYKNDPRFVALCARLNLPVPKAKG